MEDRKDSKLISTLDNYGKRLQSLRDKEATSESKRTAFLDRFRNLRSTIIKPILDRIAGELEKRGHMVKVWEGDNPLFIQIAIEADGVKGRDNVRLLRFMPDERNKRVSFEKGGFYESRSVDLQRAEYNRIGDYSESEINPELIEDNVVKIIDELALLLEKKASA